jgi:hypothetical protein
MWIKSKRQKMDVEYNILLLNIPKMILEKYSNNSMDGKALPVPDW